VLAGSKALECSSWNIVEICSNWNILCVQWCAYPEVRTCASKLNGLRELGGA
jgi:hypothetical protein